MKIVNVKLDWIFSKYGGAFVTGMAAEYTHTSSCTEPDLPQTAIIGLPLCIVTWYVQPIDSTELKTSVQ